MVAARGLSGERAQEVVEQLQALRVVLISGNAGADRMCGWEGRRLRGVLFLSMSSPVPCHRQRLSPRRRRLVRGAR